jgi:hypothetical protein
MTTVETPAAVAVAVAVVAGKLVIWPMGCQSKRCRRQKCVKAVAEFLSLPEDVAAAVVVPYKAEMAERDSRKRL